MDSIEIILLRDENGKFIALDRASGGYPYATSFLQEAKWWKSEDEALEYMSASDPFTLYYAQVFFSNVREF